MRQTSKFECQKLKFVYFTVKNCTKNHMQFSSWIQAEEHIIAKVPILHKYHSLCGCCLQNLESSVLWLSLHPVIANIIYQISSCSNLMAFNCTWEKGQPQDSQWIVQFSNDWLLGNTSSCIRNEVQKLLWLVDVNDNVRGIQVKQIWLVYPTTSINDPDNWDKMKMCQRSWTFANGFFIQTFSTLVF